MNFEIDKILPYFGEDIIISIILDENDYECVGDIEKILQFYLCNIKKSNKLLPECFIIFSDKELRILNILLE
jgi:hypothetical protein